MPYLLSAVASAAPLWQGQTQFEEAVRLQNELHKRTIQAENENHRQEQALEFALHRRSLALDKELHYGEMSHAIDIARREAVRDVWMQKSQLIQTLMIVSTLMFSCAAAIFCEGDLPTEGTPVHIARLYAFVLGTAMGALIASVWLSMLLQARMSRYDMHRPRQVYLCGRTHLHFNEYFGCHCQRLQRLSFGTFVAGTAATVAGGGMYLSAAMRWDFQEHAAAWVFTVLTAVAFAVALAGLIASATSGPDDSIDVGGLAAVETERAELLRKAASSHAKPSQMQQKAETAALDE
jgi:hypothetical protein